MGNTKLTPQTTARFCEGIRIGMTYELASQYAGICRRTYHRWISEADADPSGPEGVFRDAVRKAEADGAALHLANIARAAKDGTWQASAWLMERRHGYSSRTDIRQEVSGPNGGPVETSSRLSLEGLSPDQIEAVLAGLYDE